VDTQDYKRPAPSADEIAHVKECVTCQVFGPCRALDAVRGAVVAPAWCVVCDDVPKTPHVRDEGHVCRNPQPRLPT